MLPNTWVSIGPDSAVYPVATSRTNAPYVASGRITALAIDPRCQVTEAEDASDDDLSSCRLYVGAAGGGVWRTDRPFSRTPNWKFTSGSFDTNAIGAIAIDPLHPDTVYAGTGEPNSSGDSAAGLGLYRSRDQGENWQPLASSLTYNGPTGAVTLPNGFNNLSISSIVFDPRDTRTMYVATTLGLRGVSATSGAVVAPTLAPAGLYKSMDGGVTFTQIWNGGGASCAPSSAPCLTSWGVDRVALDPRDPGVVYASAVDVGIWRSWPQENGGAFTQIFFSQNQANAGSDRTDFAVAALPKGKTRIYAATGATGAFPGFPAPQTSYSQVWRIDDARRPASTLISEQLRVVPGGLAAATGGWKKLTTSVLGDPGYATYNFCTGQCWYDMGIYSPPGRPDTVFVIGSYSYGEAYSGPSNARAVLRSTTAGDPDPANNNVTFTDLTFDAQTPDPASANWLTATTAIHPDQHALVFAPGNSNIWFEGSDGGLVRSSSSYLSISATCIHRGLSGPALVTCQQLLSSVPKRLLSLNAGLDTLQFQHLSINPYNPLGELQGGTQDNGTFQYEGSSAIWYESVGGDGGLSGFDASNPVNRFHTYFGVNADINFASGDPTRWLYISDPLARSGESSRFYMPIIADPRADRGGTMFAGLQWIWRTTDNGGTRSFLESNCNESGPFTNSGQCGDWQRLGNRRLTGGTVSMVTRATGDSGTLWAGTASGRVYIFKNADAIVPSTAGEFEVSDALVANNSTPVRFVSGIAIDPLNSNHGWVSYGGYNAVSPPGQTRVPGHVFDVTWDGVAAHAVFTSLDGSGSGALGDLPINALVRDDRTGDLYAATDFAVLRRDAVSGHWHLAAKGMPMVEISSLAIDQATRVLYGATHGRGAWRLQL
ncbi:MAG: exo-alpha-sialidase [Pseudomonadota bacterium]|nr:exo-alpha-sialidase [Pseudomonadota bacterium]